MAFGSVLLLIDQIAPRSWLLLLIGTAWLLLLILYIILGVAFTRFNARLLRRSFGLEELRVQRRMAIWSGFPFYAFCLLCLLVTIDCFRSLDTVEPATLYASGFGFLGFILVSCSYLLLLRFFLGRS